jgi:hypothetical protein
MRYAKNNENSLLTGRNLFLQYNLIRLQAGLSILTTFGYLTPSYWDYQIVVGYSISILNRLYLDQTLSTLNHFMLFKASAPVTLLSSDKTKSAKVCKLVFRGGLAYEFSADYQELYGRYAIVGEYIDIVYQIFHINMPFIFQVQSKRVLVQSA